MVAHAHTPVQSDCSFSRMDKWCVVLNIPTERNFFLKGGSSVPFTKGDSVSFASHGCHLNTSGSFSHLGTILSKTNNNPADCSKHGDTGKATGVEPFGGATSRSGGDQQARVL